MLVRAEVTTCLRGKQPSHPNYERQALLHVASLNRKDILVFSHPNGGLSQPDLQRRIILYLLVSQDAALRKPGYKIRSKRPSPQAENVAAGLSRHIDSV